MIRFLTLISALVLWSNAAQAELDIKEVTTPKGFKAWLVEEHAIPFVALRFGFKGGAALDAEGKRGATYFMTGLLEEGAGDLDSQQFASAVGDLAAQFRFEARDDALFVSARMLSENRTEAADLLRLALLEPAFDPEAIERLRAQVLSSLKSDLKDPQKIASAAFDAAGFGDHPYGSAREGTVESVSALTRDDLMAAYKNALAQDRVLISAVGDITQAELAELVDKLLGGLPETGAPLPAQIEDSLPAGISVTPFETPQSVAIFGHGGIKRDHPDFFPAFIAATILGGGGFDNRLMTEVREKRGLTYSIYATLAPMEFSELVIGRVASANDKMAETIKVIQREWSHFAQEGVTQEELESTKTYLTGSYPLRFDGNGPIANILVGMQMNDLAADYVNTRNAKINAVTLDQVNDVIKRVFLPEALHFTVVGQPSGL